MSEIEQSVAKKIIDRGNLGEKKYGVTMQDASLTMREWVNHLQEELMDAAVYAEKIMKQGLEQQDPPETPVYTIDDFYKGLRVKCYDPIWVPAYAKPLRPSDPKLTIYGYVELVDKGRRKITVRWDPIPKYHDPILFVRSYDFDYIEDRNIQIVEPDDHQLSIESANFVQQQRKKLTSLPSEWDLLMEMKKLVNDKDRWDFIIKHKDNPNLPSLELDNDDLFITFYHEEDEEGDDCTTISFDHHIGNSDGVFILLERLGIKADGV